MQYNNNLHKSSYYEFREFDEKEKETNSKRCDSRNLFLSMYPKKNPINAVKFYRNEKKNCYCPLQN